MTLFERATTMLGRSAPIAAGGTILYSRGDLCADGLITCVFGRTEFQVSDSSGVRLEYSDRDFVFSASALGINGELATPQRGDRIEVIREDGLDNETFEVLAPAGSQVYRRCDPNGTLIRVHGKRVA